MSRRAAWKGRWSLSTSARTSASAVPCSHPVPARVAPRCERKPRNWPQRRIVALDYVGTLAGGDVRGSRRVGRSGSLSTSWPRGPRFRPLDDRGRATSQFEQHIRAIAGWPLGSPRGGANRDARPDRRRRRRMARHFSRKPDLCCIFTAGWRPARARKMGHVTRVFAEPPQGSLDSARRPVLGPGNRIWNSGGGLGEFCDLNEMDSTGS